jgi:hypothetical protein
MPEQYPLSEEPGEDFFNARYWAAKSDREGMPQEAALFEWGGATYIPLTVGKNFSYGQEVYAFGLKTRRGEGVVRIRKAGVVTMHRIPMNIGIRDPLWLAVERLWRSLP